MIEPVPDAIFYSIIQAIAAGMPVQTALEDHGCSRYEYDKARRADPTKAEAHARARQDGVDAMADAVPHIADTEDDPQRAKNRIEARKWLASVVKPREYGQRLDLVVTPGADPAQLHDEGRARALAMRSGRDLALIAAGQHAVLTEVLPAGNTDAQPASTPDASIFD